jgi:putative protease
LESDAGRNIELYGNYTLNLLNSAALRAAGHLSYQGALFSLETEGGNLAASIFHFKRQGGRGRAGKSGKTSTKMQVGVYVYGHPPLFTARLDSEHFNYHQTFISPQEEQFVLEHGDGLTTARSVAPFSLLKWRQELAMMGVDFLLLDLTGGSSSQEAATVSTLLVQGGKQRPAKGAAKGKQPAVLLQGNFDGVLV